MKYLRVNWAKEDGYQSRGNSTEQARKLTILFNLTFD